MTKILIIWLLDKTNALLILTSDNGTILGNNEDEEAYITSSHVHVLW